MLRVGRSLLALVAGIAVMFVVQLALTRAWGAAGITWSNRHPPLLLSQQAAALLTSFVAIGSGAALIARLAGRHAGAALVVFAALGIAVDTYAMFFVVDGLPLWFRLAFVATVPLAVLVSGAALTPGAGPAAADAAPS